MKNLNLILLLLILSAFISCKKDAPVEPIDQLPAATTSGRNIAGCLVNGKALVPKAGTLGPGGNESLNCYYQYLNDSFGEGFYFGLSFRNTKDKPSRSVYVQSKFLELEEGKTYPLTTYGVDGNAYAFYTVYTEATGPIDYYTNETQKGELTITRLDEYNQIISGTFWFDAVNEKGEKVEVREGRFDMKYVK